MKKDGRCVDMQAVYLWAKCETLRRKIESPEGKREYAEDVEPKMVLYTGGIIVRILVK